MQFSLCNWTNSNERLNKQEAAVKKERPKKRKKNEEAQANLIEKEAPRKRK